METIETAVPNWQGIPVVDMSELVFKGHVYTYCVLDTSALLKLATICKDGVLAVSADYPKEYRELALIHELLEFTSWQGKHRTRQCSCMRALEQELAIAKNRGVDMNKYLKLRLEFFDGVVEFYEERQRAGSITEEEIEILEHVTASLDHLKSLA